jgi:preprotein translocase subunit YajC
MQLLHAMIQFAAAQNGGGGGGNGGGQNAAPGFSFFIPMVVILIVFFWFTHRSQKKKEQDREDMIDSIQPKDDVVTIGGIHGRVISVNEETFTLRIDKSKDVQITINKSAVGRKVGDEPEEEAA